MSKATTSTAVVLALLTGLVLGQLGSLATQPGAFRSRAPNDAEYQLETARGFYDNVNHLLETGDRAIEATLAPGFTEHLPEGNGERTLPEMVDWLLALRATWPKLRITVVSLDQHDAWIVARLKIDPGPPQALSGALLLEIDSEFVNEYLQVEGNQVTDRWSAVMDVPVATLNFQTQFTWKSSQLTVPAIERVSLAPDSMMRFPLEGPAMLLVESGSVRIDRASSDADGNGHSGTEPIRDGEVRMLENAAALQVRNLSHDPADIWIFASNAGVDSQTERNAPDGSVITRIFAFMPLLTLSPLATSKRISVTRITLPPGAAVAPHSAGIVETIAVVEGAVETTVERGYALLCADHGTAIPFDDTATIAAGAGFGMKGFSSFSYRVAGTSPATLLVMRIDSGTSPSE